MKINKLRYRNFKGAKETDITFTNQTDISGDNAVGKTRVFDSVLWLLFDKDSEGKSDFDIKPLDKDNNTIHKVDVEVEGEFDVDGRTLLLMKIYREKWTKKKGSTEAELTGHETIYYIDQLTVKKADYAAYISNLIDPEVFRLITNPSYFQSLHWSKRREILFSLIDEMKDSDVAAGSDEFAELMDKIQGKTLDQHKKQLAATRKKAADELKLIPSRIDEVHVGMPDARDFDALRLEKTQLESQYIEVQTQLLDKTKAFGEKIRTLNLARKECNDIDDEIREIEHAASVHVNSQQNSKQNLKSELTNAVERYKIEINGLQSKIKIHQNNASELDRQLVELRDEWTKQNQQTFNFDPDSAICPTCKRTLENADEIELELQQNFHTDKRTRLSRIEENADGTSKTKDSTKATIEELLALVAKYEADLKLKEKELEQAEKPLETKSVEELLNSSTEYQQLLKTVKEKRENLPTFEMDTKSLEETMKNIDVQIKEISSKLADEIRIIESKNRIKELEEKMATMSQQIADIEKQEYTCQQFMKQKIGLIEKSVNSLFCEDVNFKLYNTLIGGGEEECCITLIKGVPYASANYAGRVNAGLDIINTLSKHYSATAPIFIDNRESISEIIPLDTQIINLNKVKGQKTLLIKNL